MPTTNAESHHGQCLCGGVQYRVAGPLRGVIACHCSQCRRTSGHYSAYSSADSSALTLSAASSLRWYRSSDTAERGFCERCGSNLFWRQFGSPSISIAAGSLDGPTGLTLERHIFVADQGDYYPLDDSVPKLQAW